LTDETFEQEAERYRQPAHLALPDRHQRLPRPVLAQRGGGRMTAFENVDFARFGLPGYLASA
jgi:hypothetical protein